MQIYFQKSVHNLGLLCQIIPNGFIQWETIVNKKRIYKSRSLQLISLVSIKQDYTLSKHIYLDLIQYQNLCLRDTVVNRSTYFLPQQRLQSSDGVSKNFQFLLIVFYFLFLSFYRCEVIFYCYFSFSVIAHIQYYSVSVSGALHRGQTVRHLTEWSARHSKSPLALYQPFSGLLFFYGASSKVDLQYFLLFTKAHRKHQCFRILEITLLDYIQYGFFSVLRVITAAAQDMH